MTIPSDKESPLPPPPPPGPPHVVDTINDDDEEEEEEEQGTPDGSGRDDHQRLPYSAFSARQKTTILLLAACAGWFSSASSFMYFPAIPALARATLRTTTTTTMTTTTTTTTTAIERINLTVTSYLVVSGVAPCVVGNAADRFGRRPVVLAALTVYLGANLGLALQRPARFALLFCLRMLQSAGISGTFCITYGVLSDLFTPAERGGYSGTVSLLLNTPPSIGPLISGLLLLKWSWRSIFWFLSIATPCCLVPMLLIFPETARSIVGDGSRRAPVANRPVLPILLVSKTARVGAAAAAAAAAATTTTTTIVQSQHCDGSRDEPEADGSTTTTTSTKKTKKRTVINPLASLKLIRRPATALVLLNYGTGYATYSCLQASLSTLFLEKYSISGLASGLIYIPFGVACALSAFFTGRLLDRNYQKTAAEAGFSSTSASASASASASSPSPSSSSSIGQTGGSAETQARITYDLSHFPIEKARLRTITWSTVMCACLIASYGWQLQAAVPQGANTHPHQRTRSLAGALVTQFLIGLTLQPMFTALNTLLVDLHPEGPSTAQAACNLVRCELAAGYLAALDVLLQALGPGWTFVLFAAVLFAGVLLLFVLERKGLAWRMQAAGKGRLCAGTERGV